jgi:hypothetical protein
MKRIALAAILIFTVASGIDNGGPVNPTYYKSEGQARAVVPKSEGISLRDYFAASYIASRDLPIGDAAIKQHADIAYRLADAMLERRKR